jgi:serine/threonine-protein kinase
MSNTPYEFLPEHPDSEFATEASSRRSRKGDQLIGTTLQGEYQIIDLLGEGGMARVYKALQLSVRRYVAIKALTSTEPDVVARFANEVRLVSQLQHQNIVQALDYIVDPASGKIFFVMEYLPGMTLEDLLKTQKRLATEDDIASVIGQLCDALRYAHQKGIIHRDLKPANVILLERDGNVIVKVVDFGIARVEADLQRLTRAGAVVGSPLYMSPEQCMGEHVDSRADIYSLGAIVYELITGELPYPETSVMKVMAAHCDPARHPEPVETKVQLKNPRQLNQIIRTAMETEPQSRFQSMDEMKHALTFWYNSQKEGRADIEIPISRETSVPMLATKAGITTTESRSLHDLVRKQQDARDPTQKVWRSPELFTSISDLRPCSTIAGAQFEQFTQHEPLVDKVIFKKYKVLSLLGEGGMAVVYRAQNVETGELVAIKTLKFSETDLGARFAREVSIHEQLKHPNIVRSIECLETSTGQAFFVMELLNGIVLEDQIETRGRVNDVTDICTILGQILDAIEFAHEKGVIHRDIKPENVFLTQQNGQLTVKVLDFGLAQIQEDLQRLTKTGIVLGSPAYMSPEQCMGQTLDTRSDLYSLGILAYEIITATLPIMGENEVEVMDGHCNPSVIPAPISTYRKDIPELDTLNDILLKCLAKDPTDRYKSVTELKIDLHQWWLSAVAKSNSDLISPFRVSRRKQEMARTEKVEAVRPETQRQMSNELASLLNDKRQNEREAFASRFKNSTLPGEGKRSVVKPLIITFCVLAAFATIYLTSVALERIMQQNIQAQKTKQADQLSKKTGQGKTDSTEPPVGSDENKTLSSVDTANESKGESEEEQPRPRRRRNTGVRVLGPGQFGR